MQLLHALQLIVVGKSNFYLVEVHKMRFGKSTFVMSFENVQVVESRHHA